MLELASRGWRGIDDAEAVAEIERLRRGKHLTTQASTEEVIVA